LLCYNGLGLTVRALVQLDRQSLKPRVWLSLLKHHFRFFWSTFECRSARSGNQSGSLARGGHTRAPGSMPPSSIAASITPSTALLQYKFEITTLSSLSSRMLYHYIAPACRIVWLSTVRSINLLAAICCMMDLLIECEYEWTCVRCHRLL
jgi:hypothetical protein